MYAYAYVYVYVIWLGWSICYVYDYVMLDMTVIEPRVSGRRSTGTVGPRTESWTREYVPGMGKVTAGIMSSKLGDSNDYDILRNGIESPGLLWRLDSRKGLMINASRVRG